MCQNVHFMILIRCECLATMGTLIWFAPVIEDPINCEVFVTNDTLIFCMYIQMMVYIPIMSE